MSALPGRRSRGLTASVLLMLLLLLATTTPAHAFTTYTPSGGSQVDFRSSNITLTNTSTGMYWTCGGGVPTNRFDLGGTVVNPGVSRPYGAAAAALTTLTTAPTVVCHHPICHASATMVGTWSLAMTGDPTAGSWPARLSGVKLRLYCAGYEGLPCTFTLTGTIDGQFTPATQRFTPSAGYDLTVEDQWVCADLDVLQGDAFAVGGYWTNVPPSGSSPLLVTNP